MHLPQNKLTRWAGSKSKLSSQQRWSPRGRPWPRGRPRWHILKSLASKVKFLVLASRPQVLENWPVLGSRTALFFELLKFCGALEKFFGKRSFVEIAWKIFVKTFFFGEHLLLCPWPRECLSSERLSLASDFFCVLGLEPCVLDSTSASQSLYRYVLMQTVKSNWVSFYIFMCQ